MLRTCLVCCVVATSTGCKTLHEADAAMSAWTRDHLADKPEEESKPTASAAPPSSSAPARAGAKANAAKAEPELAKPGGATDSDPAARHAPDAASVAAAEALFESGHEAMSQGDYDTACARFEESNRLDPAVGSLLNLAVCEEKRGRLATAWQLFKRVMSDLPAGDDRYPIAQRRASALRPRVPRLTLALESGASKQTTVRYLEAVLGQASFDVPLPFDPGDHTFYVSAPQREPREYHVTLGEGDQKVLTVGPGDPK